MNKTKLRKTSYSEAEAGITEEKTGLRALFPYYREKDEILQEIYSNPQLESTFSCWEKERQEEFLDFCCGNRGVKVLYDTFFKIVFNPDSGKDNLIRLISVMIGRPVKEIMVLPAASQMGGDRSLVIMDIVVQTEDGSIINVEVQKHGYMFPGERAACYSADLLLRQYQRVRREASERLSEARKKGKKTADMFSYRDIRPVITIVFMESSTAEFHKFPDRYVHTITGQSDTGLRLNVLQQYIFVPLDIFKENMKKYGIRSEQDAWAAFLSSDSPEVICTLIEQYPEQFLDLYRKLSGICQNTEGVMNMFSEELAILDRNTVILMQEEMKKEIELQKAEIERNKVVLEQNKAELEQNKAEIERSKAELSQSREELNQSREELNQSREELNQSREELNQSREELNQTKTEIERQKAENERLNKLIAELQEKLAQTEADLK